MSNIAKAFAQGKAFIPFITCGDPDLETTAEIVRAMARAGADLIELGIPFSDPTAEGPVIQAAIERFVPGNYGSDIFRLFACRGGFSEGVFWFGVHEGEGDDWFVFPIMLSPAFVVACEQVLSFFIPKEGISSYQKQPP